MSDQPMKSTFKDERQWSLLSFRSRAWSRGSFRTCHWLAEWVRWLSDCSVKRSGQPLRPVLGLDPCSDGDINYDVSSLYVEIIDKNRSYYKCTICGRKLSRKQSRNPLELCSWQRWEITQANHNFECDYKSSFTLIFIKEGYHIWKYKRYIDDPSVPVPKSTKLDRSKRSATRSNTAISIPQSVVSTELKAVVTTE